jgi:hypothetical protein
MDTSSVNRPLDAVQRVDQSRFAMLGLGTVNARLDLADATPADDAAAIMAHRGPLAEGPRGFGARRRSIERFATQAGQWVRGTQARAPRSG